MNQINPGPGPNQRQVNPREVRGFRKKDVSMIAIFWTSVLLLAALSAWFIIGASVYWQTLELSWAITGGLLTAVLLALFFLYDRGHFVVEENQVAIIEYFGRYICTLEAGFHLIVPLGIMKVKNQQAIFLGDVKLDLFKDRKPVDFTDASAPVVAFAWICVVDSYKVSYAIADVYTGVTEKLESAIRAYMAPLSLDEANADKATLNLGTLMTGTKLAINDFSYENSPIFMEMLSWGIKVKSAVVSDIDISPEDRKIRQEMLEADKARDRAKIEKEKKKIDAEAEAESSLIIAEAKKKAAIIAAHGERESLAVVAEGKKKAAIIASEGDRVALAQTAEGKREATVLEGRGKAESLKLELKTLTKSGVSPEQAGVISTMKSQYEAIKDSDKILLSGNRDLDYGATFGASSQFAKDNNKKGE